MKKTLVTVTVGSALLAAGGVSAALLIGGMHKKKKIAEKFADMVEELCIVGDPETYGTEKSESAKEKFIADIAELAAECATK